MHTWSLSVEEQFYFIFPFITWITGFSNKREKGVGKLFITLLILSTVSIISFIFLYQRNPSYAYFLMPTRFWEISLGALLFIGIKKNLFILQKAKKISPIYFFILIIFLMLLPQSYPANSIILVTFLSALLINSLEEKTYLQIILSKKNIVYLGKISYSLYLWHWGVFSISRWTVGIHWWSIPFQLLITYFIAFLSYEYLEKPIRYKDWSFKKLETIPIGIISLISTSLLVFIFYKPLLGKLYLGSNKMENNTLKKEFQNYDIDYYLCNYFKKELTKEDILQNCLSINYKDSRTFFFVGDSHTQHFWRGAEYIANKTRSNVFYFSSGTLFPKVSEEKETFIEMSKLINEIEEEIVLNSKSGDVVFIKIRMPFRFLDNWYEIHSIDGLDEWLSSLDNFLNRIKEKDVNVVIFTPTPEFPIARYKQCKTQNPEWFNQLSKKDCLYPKSYFDKGGYYSEIIEELEDIAYRNENLFLFDALEAMCENSICKYNDSNESLYTDDDHITDYSARYIIAPQLLEFLEKNSIY